MTLTNHTCLIAELAGYVQVHADNKEYHKAHCALDDIETKVRTLRLHIDHLQRVADCAARPPGGA